MRFVDVTNDVAFRKIFGNEKKSQILISFLNAILNLKGDYSIAHIQLLNPYQLPRIAGEKASIIDVKAKDAQGRQFIVEMQLADTHGFDKRVQYYMSKEYASQIDSGQEYKLLKPTYFIGILDFNFFESKDYLSQHVLLDKKTLEHKFKDISLTFIELDKFTLTVHELKTLTEKWIYFIKNSGTLEFIPEHTDDAGLVAAYEDAERYSWSKKEISDYEDAYLALRDEENRLAFAEEKAMEKGTEDEKHKTAERCLLRGMDITLTSEISGLPIEEVDRIKQNVKP